MKYAYEKLGERSFYYYGIKAEQRGNFPFLRGPKEKPLGYVGVEFEQAFSAHMGDMRRMIQYWIDTKVIEEKDRPISLHQYQQKTMELFSESYVVIPAPHRDSGGVECVMAPSTLWAHQQLKEEYKLLLAAYTELGYDAHLGQCGIHTNIDYSLFGARNEDERWESIRLFLWFLFNAADFMLDLSHRQGAHTVKADLMTMLGNQMGNFTEKAVKKAFLSIKEEVANFFGDRGSRSWARYFNKSYGRDGRPAVEFRWFGSTSNVDTLLMMIEFSFAIAEFIRTHRSQDHMDLAVFCSWIRANNATYPHLGDEMRNNRWSMPYMTDHFSPEVAEIPARRLVAIY